MNINRKSLGGKTIKPIEDKDSISQKGKINVPLMTFPKMSQFLYLKRFFNITRKLDGDIVECGVGKGASLAMFAFLVKDEGKGRKIWGFDSFQGFPEPSQFDRSIRNPQKGQWSDTSILAVLEFLNDCELDEHFVNSQITLVGGFFDDSLSKYKGSSIALLHLDADLYDSYRIALNALYPKVVSGGVILFDEYMGTREYLKFPGAQRAIDEYFGDDKDLISRDEITGKYYFIKQ